jgi:hypothetical protein
MKKLNQRALIFLIPIVAGFFIASFAPEDILGTFTFLQNVTSELKSLFPPIAGYAGKSKFPQVTECYFSFMWLLSPYYFWVSIQVIRHNDGLKNWKPRNWIEKVKVFLVGVVLLSILGYFEFFINPGYDFNLLPINSSRFALATSGFLFSGAAAAYLFAVAYCLLEKIAFSK